MSQEAESLGTLVFAHSPVLGHRRRDRVIEAQVEGLKLDGGDWYRLFDREFRDGLANASVVVNDLGNRETLLQQLAAVPRSALADRYIRFMQCHSQRFSELIEEQRNAVFEFHVC